VLPAQVTVYPRGSTVVATEKRSEGFAETTSTSGRCGVSVWLLLREVKAAFKASLRFAVLGLPHRSKHPGNPASMTATREMGNQISKHREKNLFIAARTTMRQRGRVAKVLQVPAP